MLYDPETGHRIKEPRSYVTWVHTDLHYEEYNLKQCFFGEHLLSAYPNKSVAIVESEKSALIATHFMPDFVGWDYVLSSFGESSWACYS